MSFEHVLVDWDKQSVCSQTTDDWMPTALVRLAQATLMRSGTPASRWILWRIDCPPIPPRVIVLPQASGGLSENHATLWLANLREQALELGFCAPDESWCEPVRLGWNATEPNSIQDTTFSSSGGALAAESYASWQDFCAKTCLPEKLLCTLPWTGLPSMWGPSFGSVHAAREADILQSFSPAPLPSTQRRRGGRGKKA